jgi:hypothetical protein
MSGRVEIPFPPRPDQTRSARVEPPWVPIEPRWEYKDVVRNLETDGPPSETELNALGSEHWELAGVLREGLQAHFYFKRERVG